MNGAHTVFVVALLVAGCATRLPSAMRVAPAAASPSDAVEGEWERLDLPNGDASFNGVAATEHDVVIVGGRAMGAVAWVSHDLRPVDVRGWRQAMHSQGLPSRSAIA